MHKILLYIALALLLTAAVPLCASNPLTDHDFKQQLGHIKTLNDSGLHEQAMTRTEQLMQLDLSDEQRNQASECYVNAGLDQYVQCESNNDYAAARGVLKRVLPYATLPEEVLALISQMWLIEGVKTRSYACLDSSRVIVHELGMTENEISLYLGMATLTADPAQALALYDRAYHLSDSIHNYARMAKAKRDLAKFHSEAGHADLAALALAQADSLSQLARIMGDKKELITRYTNIAKNTLKQKRYNLAEGFAIKAYHELQDFKKEHPNEENPNELQLYTYLRDIYRKTSRFEQATAWGKKAITLSIDLTGDAAFYWAELADVYTDKADYDSAWFCIEKAQANKPQIMSEGMILKTCTRLCWLQNDYERAYHYACLADSVVQNSSKDLQMSRKMDRGWLARLAGHYDDAVTVLEQYRHLLEENRLNTTQGYADAIAELAHTESQRGDNQRAKALYEQAADVALQVMRRDLRFATPGERETLWKDWSWQVQQMHAFAQSADAKQEHFTRTAYNLNMATKGLLLQSNREALRTIAAVGTPDDSVLYHQVQELNGRIATLSKDFDDNVEQIIACYDQVSSLERKLSGRLNELADHTQFLDTDYTQVRDAMSRNDVLIDFTYFESESGQRHYAAYVVNRRQEHPLLVDVFTQEQLDSLMPANEDLLYEGATAQQLARLCWQPLLPHIPAGANVYLVPSGVMHRLAVEWLPAEGGKLMGERNTVVRLTSARELVRRHDKLDIQRDDRANLYGGLHYTIDSTTMLAQSQAHPLPAAFSTMGAEPSGNQPWRDLPLTARGVTAVAEVLQRQHLNVTSYTGNQGTEEAFLTMSGHAPRILLMDTHGFYYTPAEAEREDYLKGYTDAMMLSGLVLAGGNAAWLGQQLPQGVRGGILTAGNIAQMNLDGLDLVVLAACQTGLGQTSPEGIYGLQRAFKQAGAGTIVMTLWKVNEQATNDFVTTFFKALADNGWDKHQAFNTAQCHVRKQYHDPYYWAAFVMLD